MASTVSIALARSAYSTHGVAPSDQAFEVLHMEMVDLVGSILLAVAAGVLAVVIHHSARKSAGAARSIPSILLILAVPTVLVGIGAKILNFAVETPLVAWFVSVAVSLSAVAAAI